MHNLNPMAISHILLVEDSDEDFYATRRAFQHAHCANPIKRTINGDEALDYLFQRGKYSNPHEAPRPGVILLDLNLPGTDGREVLKQIKSEPLLHTIPVIVLTTSLDERDIKACYAAGANSYVKKPVDFPNFVSAVQRLQDYWFELNILPSNNGGAGS